MPGPRCNVYLCSNQNGKLTKDGKRITFHRFPKRPALRKLWVEKCHKTGNWNVDYGYICSEHFRKNDFKRDLQAELLNYKGRRKLKPFAVPSLNLPNDCETESGTDAEKEDQDKLVEKCLLNVSERIPLSFELFKKLYKEHSKGNNNVSASPLQTDTNNKSHITPPSRTNNLVTRTEERRDSEYQLKRNIAMQKKMMEKVFLATYFDEPFSEAKVDSMDDEYVAKALLKICALAPKSYNRFAKQLNLPCKDMLLSWNNKNVNNTK